MADKEQIIIDDVDISKCDSECFFSKCRGSRCAKWSVLKMKELEEQLARKTQECEQKEKELKELKRQYKLSCLDCEYKNTKADVERYRKECENLKAEEKYLKQCCEKAGEELSKHSFDYDGKEKNLVIQTMELNEKYEKFEKVLDEIEEIAKSFNKSELCFYKEINECDCCDMGADCNYLRRAKILYIINKVKGEKYGDTDEQ